MHFCGPQPEVVINLVKEFYANYDKSTLGTPEIVFVWGRQNKLTSAAINQIYQLGDDDDDYTEFGEGLDKDQLDELFAPCAAQTLSGKKLVVDPWHCHGGTLNQKQNSGSSSSNLDFSPALTIMQFIRSESSCYIIFWRACTSILAKWFTIKLLSVLDEKRCPLVPISYHSTLQKPSCAHRTSRGNICSHDHPRHNYPFVAQWSGQRKWQRRQQSIRPSC